ncbi:hypothetical protein N9W07_00195 [Alphaproteobacteria bacterium]|nr:hypothetical protein [Alphaproteobacteria bacterium]
METFNENITFGIDVITWIIFIEIPIFIALITYIIKQKETINNNIDLIEKNIEKRYRYLNEKINNYKLEVAQKYASVAYLKDVENRLTNHLIRIEEKLDNKLARIENE